jgi:hypothetical protein
MSLLYTRSRMRSQPTRSTRSKQVLLGLRQGPTRHQTEITGRVGAWCHSREGMRISHRFQALDLHAPTSSAERPDVGEEEWRLDCRDLLLPPGNLRRVTARVSSGLGAQAVATVRSVGVKPAEATSHCPWSSTSTFGPTSPSRATVSYTGEDGKSRQTPRPDAAQGVWRNGQQNNTNKRTES